MKIDALIAIDLDGTLLTPRYEILPYTESMIKALSDVGAKIVLASGRPLRNILPYYDKLGLETPVIAYNGSLVINPVDKGFPRFERRIDASFLYGILSRHGDKLKNVYLESSDDTHFLLKDEKRLYPYFPNAGENRENTIKTLVDHNPFIAVFEPNDDDFDALCGDINASDKYKAHPWTGLPYIEIASKGADKGEALRMIAEALGYSRDKIYAYGDGDNDYSMLAFAKNGFAIKNARSSFLKESFPTTEKGNEEEGVAHSLAKEFGMIV